VGKAVDSTSSLRQSMRDMEQAISSGRTPDATKNSVLMGSNESGLFVFEQFTGILKKFNHVGKLLWQKELKIPAITDLFDRIMDENKSRLNTEKCSSSLSMPAVFR